MSDERQLRLSHDACLAHIHDSHRVASTEQTRLVTNYATIQLIIENSVSKVQISWFRTFDDRQSHDSNINLGIGKVDLDVAKLPGAPKHASAKRC